MLLSLKKSQRTLHKGSREGGSMDGYREKKQPVVFFIVLFAVALYGGYCLGPLSEKDLDLLTLRQDIEHALLHPLPFHFGSGTILGIGIAMVLWLKGITDD